MPGEHRLDPCPLEVEADEAPFEPAPAALELEGAPAEVEQAVAWLREQGVQVEPIEKNVIE